MSTDEEMNKAVRLLVLDDDTKLAGHVQFPMVTTAMVDGLSEKARRVYATTKVRTEYFGKVTIKLGDDESDGTSD